MISFTDALWVSNPNGGVDVLVGLTDGQNHYDIVLVNPSDDVQNALTSMNEGVFPVGAE